MNDRTSPEYSHEITGCELNPYVHSHVSRIHLLSAVARRHGHSVAAYRLKIHSQYIISVNLISASLRKLTIVPQVVFILTESVKLISAYLRKLKLMPQTVFTITENVDVVTSSSVKDKTVAQR